MLNYLLCQLTAVQADGFGQVTKLLCGGTHGALRHNAQLLAVPAYCCASWALGRLLSYCVVAHMVH